MSRLYITIVSIWAWAVLGTCMLLWLPLLAAVRVLTLPFDPGRYWAGLLFRKVGVITATLNPLWRFRVTGAMPANPRHPYVAVSNHESFVDILLLCHLPWEMKWLSKVEILRIPVLGWDMWLAGDVPVERGTARSAVKAMRRCRGILQHDRVSVMIFPEGTRSPRPGAPSLQGRSLPPGDRRGGPDPPHGGPRNRHRPPETRLALRSLRCRGPGARAYRHHGADRRGRAGAPRSSSRPHRSSPGRNAGGTPGSGSRIT